MSTATTIQAQIAYDVMDNYNPDAAVLDLSKSGYLVESANDEVEAETPAKNVTIEPQAHGASLATALTLDDFGGRSDALGG
jgi:hypothetical protein